MQALRKKKFNHIMFLCKVKNAVGKSTIAKQHQVKCTVVGEAYTRTVCTVLRISYMYVHIYIYMCVCVRKFRRQCVSYTWLAATYRSCYHCTLMSLPSPVLLCPLLMFRIAAISEICNVNHFCSETSVKPQHRKNGILCRNRKASYE